MKQSIFFALLILFGVCAESYAISWNNMLLNAAEEGDLEQVETCLANGAAPDYVKMISSLYYNSKTPLVAAIKGGHFEIFQSLIAAKPDFSYLNQGKTYVLSTAAGVDDDRYLLALLDYGISPTGVIFKLIDMRKYETCIKALDYLHSAPEYFNKGRIDKDQWDSYNQRFFRKIVTKASLRPYDEDAFVEIARKALAQGLIYNNKKDAYGKIPIERAFEQGLMKLVRVLEPDGEYSNKLPPQENSLERQLFSAVSHLRTEVVRRLLKQGADIHAVDPKTNKGVLGFLPHSSIHKAEQLDMLSILLDAGADPNQVSEDIYNSLAPFFSSVESWKLVKKRGFIIPKEKSERCRLLLDAFKADSTVGPAILRDLLESGMSPNPVEGGACYPLIFAMQNIENWDAIPLLLEFGADPNMKGQNGKSAADVAIENKDVYSLFRLFPKKKHPFFKKIGPKGMFSSFPGIWSNNASGFGNVSIVLTPDGGAVLSAGVGGALGYWEEKGNGIVDATFVEPTGSNGVKSATLHIKKETKKIIRVTAGKKDVVLSRVGKAKPFLQFIEVISGKKARPAKKKKNPIQRTKEALDKYQAETNRDPYTFSVTNFGLDTLPPKIFEFYRLKTLHIANNRLQTIPAEISKLMNLRAIYASNNRLRALPESIGNLTNLIYLDISKNQLQTLPLGLSNHPRLQEIIFSENNFQELPAGFLFPPKMDIINFKANKFSSIPEVIANHQSLGCLDMGSNNIDEVPDYITRLTKLHTLILSNNHLKTFPHQIASLKNLQKVNFSDNGIREISADLSALTKLSELDLSYNYIEVLPLSKLSLPKLKSLNLSANRLRKIEGDFKSMPTLKRLDLTLNSFQHLPPSLMTLPEGVALFIDGTGIPKKEVLDLKKNRPDLWIKFNGKYL